MAVWPNPKYEPAPPRGCARCRAALVAIADGGRGRRGGLAEVVEAASVARAAHGPASALVPDDGSPLEPGDWCRAVRLLSELGVSDRPGDDASALGEARALAARALGRAG